VKADVTNIKPGVMFMLVVIYSNNKAVNKVERSVANIKLTITGTVVMRLWSYG